VNWLSPKDVHTVAPYVREQDPDKEIVARIFVVPTSDRDHARAVARFVMAAYLTVPVYRAFHEWLGRGQQLLPMQQAWAAGDRKGALALIPDDVVDDLVIHGDPAACREQLLAYTEAGVTTPVIAILPAGIEPAVAVRELAPV
jgi:alkanesulfonate monooxygenase SsuD/methylene tetrahydromethanopterin reductase-like flavin-dependent oxidoreductase (luciferase family)